MSCLVINLAVETDRMDFMTKQLETLGLDFERVEAVTAGEAVTARSLKYWNSWERPLKDTECACMLSHFSAWEKVAVAGGGRANAYS